jgi:pSer/pThr/pTyr-binding forkhead associated (FHA) protein
MEGHIMPQLDKTQRIELELDETILPYLAENPSLLQTRDIAKRHEMMLLSDKGSRRLDLFTNHSIYVLGRFTSKYCYTNYIDLSSLGGQELGVSRIHAHIYMENNALYITDLNSKNGTYIAGSRLEANTPTAVESGAQIMLGRLQLQVILNHPSSVTKVGSERSNR